MLDCVDAVNEDVGVGALVEDDADCNIARDFVLEARAINQADGDVVSKVHIVAENMRVD